MESTSEIRLGVVPLGVQLVQINVDKVPLFICVPLCSSMFFNDVL